MRIFGMDMIVVAMVMRVHMIVIMMVVVQIQAALSGAIGIATFAIFHV